MKKLLALLLLFIALSPILPALGSPKITAKNWMRHPEVRKVRAIYGGVRKKLDRKELVKSVREIKGCESHPGRGPLWAIQKTLYTEGKKRVRLYITRISEGGIATDVEYYFDLKGRLRFIFAIYTYIPSESQVQFRVYYDARGKRIWENRRHVKGRKFVTPRQNPFYYHLGDPFKDFRKKQPVCGK